MCRFEFKFIPIVISIAVYSFQALFYPQISYLLKRSNCLINVLSPTNIKNIVI